MSWNAYGPGLSGAYGVKQGVGSLEAIQDEQTGEVVGIINNALGDGVGEVSGDKITWFEKSSAYGVLNGKPAKNQTYRGKSYDPTGFIYMGARYYDPLTARFLSPDPAGYNGSMDLYAYANGDPINYLDPDGRLYQKANEAVGSMVSNAWHNQRVQGGIQMIGGAGLVPGLAIAAHGSAVTSSGIMQMLTGNYENTVTSHGMQFLGASPGVANTIDAGLSIASGGAGLWAGARMGVTGASSYEVMSNIRHNIAANKKALESSNYGQFLAKNFYLDSGISYEKTILHLRGIDFSSPVYKTVLQKGTNVAQYQLPGFPIGKYFAPIGANPNKLGIYMNGRVENIYEATTNIPILKSRAASTIDDWSLMKSGVKIRVEGGETQYFTTFTNFLNKK